MKRLDSNRRRYFLIYSSLYFCYRRTCWCTSGQTSYVYGDLFSGWRLLSGRFEPVKIYVESKYVRAVRGGMGYAKTGGNYAASLKAQDEAEEQKYTQVLWLDGVERKYVEEVGTMNVFFVIGDEVVTPALQGSILPGVTRMSAIEILESWGLNVSERPIEIQEIYDAYQNGQLKEAFGTGTAAVISPIGQLKWDDHVMEINNGKIGEISQRLYDTLTGIQWGNIEDTMHWTVEVK